jgi:hypothetical protein
MTPKLKALSLIELMSFSKSRQMNYANGEMVDIPQNLYAKQCALLAVDEIIKSNPTSERSDPFLGNRTYENVNYWKDVKKEIEKL